MVSMLFGYSILSNVLYQAIYIESCLLGLRSRVTVTHTVKHRKFSLMQSLISLTLR
jgi:hypothetical protein